jgi:hypothetical protein
MKTRMMNDLYAEKENSRLTNELADGILGDSQGNLTFWRTYNEVGRSHG